MEELVVVLEHFQAPLLEMMNACCNALATHMNDPKALAVRHS